MRFPEDKYLDRLRVIFLLECMEEKKPIDAFGATALVGVATLLAINQIVIKVTVDGFAPVFQSGLRSAIALVIIAAWIAWFRIPLHLTRIEVVWGIIAGGFFALEFLCLFIALDLTTVSRTSILFYSMPVWLGLAAHLFLPGERLNAGKLLGMALAISGVALALFESGNGHRLGDFLALVASFSWAAIPLVVRTTPLAGVNPELQLGFQLLVSALVLLALAPLFGPLIREPTSFHLLGLVYQAIAVASLGFLGWFKLLKIYSASGVASFSFLSPVLAVVFAWMILDEEIRLQDWIALTLVAAGLVFINRR